MAKSGKLPSKHEAQVQSPRTLKSVLEFLVETRDPWARMENLGQGRTFSQKDS